MIINCPNAVCNAKLNVHDAAFKKAPPKVYCPVCQMRFTPTISNKLQQTENVTSILQKKKAAVQKALLIVHDEQTHLQSFTLPLGEATIGRKNSTKPCLFMIDTKDAYMSRNHFSISTITNNTGVADYILRDSNALNHTFLNTRKLLAGEEIYLKDGDIIQAGETKIVFKKINAEQTENQTVTLQAKKEFAHTVRLKR
jgi:pSer/pThr/pTyr-binding forkhead associated (FHA) protein